MPTTEATKTVSETVTTTVDTEVKDIATTTAIDDQITITLGIIDHIVVMPMTTVTTTHRTTDDHTTITTITKRSMVPAQGAISLH